MSGHVILCGYGRLVELVAKELRKAGRKLVIVDNDPDRTTEVEGADMLYILGDAQEDTVLNAAGIKRASELISALTTDAENVLVTLTARALNEKIRIISRGTSLTAQDKLLKAGATRVICPQIIGARSMANMVLRPAVVDFVEGTYMGLDIEMDQLEINEDSELVGKTLHELELPRRVGVHLAVILRENGETIYNPTSQLTVQKGDTLIVIGPKGSSEALRDMHL